MLPQQYCLRWKYHHSNLQTMFSQLLDRGCFCDVTLACEGQLIRAHRVVLCACSTFFDTVLTNYASERDPIIIMKDVTFADIKCLIEFMYKGEINVEHANLASLLKTADDLKIKGLAEVTWRDDDDIPPPPPTPQTEFHSPNSMQRSHTNMYDYVNSEQQQQQQHHLQQQQQQQQQSQRIRVRTPEPEIPESKASYSPKHHHHHHHHHNHSVQAQLCSRIPGLPAIPTSAVSLVTAASAAAAVAAASASAAATGINNIQHDTYMGPKRKRGRPPLDDAYDVFNVKKLTQTYGETNNNAAHASHTAHAYGENSQSNNEDGGNNGVSGGPTPTNTDEKNTSPKLSVAAAYQQHIHKQRTRQKSLRPSHVTASVEGDANMESEWINSNMEGGAADDSENKMNIKNLVKNQERNHDAHDDHDDDDDDHDYKHDNDHDHHRAYETETDVADEPQDLKITSEMKEEQDELRKRKQERRIHEKTPEKQQQQHHKSRSNKRKCSKEEQNTCSTETQAQKSDLRKKYEKLENSNEIEETVKENNTTDDTEENTECEEEVETNIKVENGENLHKSSTNSPTSSTASTSSSSSSSAATHSSESAANCNNNNNNKKSNQNLSVSSSLHHAHPAYGSFCPEGYMINEHGILMAHDFVHAPTAAIPTSSSTSSMAANGQHGEDYADIKMEEFNESELRLTSEEMTQWQDVIKMDDYLAKGRRPQFWEEPFTRRVLDAIKNKRLEMKKAARILGVSYGTLYGRYRETYGCLKHPYSNTSLRNSQSNALAIPSRFDIVWPSAKPGQLDIGKLRPKDLSELWTRPQI